MPIYNPISAVNSVINDTNVTGSISGTVLTLGWTGTLAAARLNANVVQSVVNDTNVTGSITAQALTLAWSGTLGVSRGGTGTGTQFTAGSVIFAGTAGVYSQNNANFFFDNANGRLSIGSNGAAISNEKLTIINGANAFGWLYSDGVRIDGLYSDGTVSQFGGFSAHDFALYSNSTERIRLLSSGNIQFATLISRYNGINTTGLGVPAIYGLDNRTGITVADGATTTLYTTVNGTSLFRITADIFATAYVSGTATYTITWTQNGGTRTLVVTATAINTLGTATDLINPDNATAITTQLTGVFNATLTVAGVVEQLK